MVGNLLTALFSTVGYCLLMNVPVKKIIPASVGGMLRVQSVFYLLVLVGAFAATYSEIAAKIAKTPATLFLLPALIPLVPGGSAYYAMLGLVQNRFADMRHYALLTGQWAVGLAAGICAVAVIRQIGQYMQRHGG